MTGDAPFCNYELIDCGDGRRLERFADIIVDRPAPQATWRKSSVVNAWREANAYYARPENGAGEWQVNTSLPDAWPVNMGHITLELQPGKHNQLGVFPEQLINWHWLRQQAVSQNRPLRVLNAFAYTGAATLAACSPQGNVEVCHLDGAKASVTWAKRNAELSGLQQHPIRWIVDDVLTFLNREIKRGQQYDGFILDPPAFGRGAKGEWKIQRDLPKLLECVNQLLSPTPAYVLLSCHVPGWTSQDLVERLQQLDAFRGYRGEAIDLTIKASQGNDLPSSICGRISTL